MNHSTGMIAIRLFVSMLSLCSLASSAVAQEENRVRAKVGIQIRSGDRVSQAKAMDELKAGDLIRIYVHPETSSCIYVVHTDGKTVTLLNMAQQRAHSSTLVLPSVQEAYSVDGKSPTEAFTIICSPKEIGELSDLSGAGMSYEKWIALEKSLTERSRVEIGQKTERPFPVIGNVRGESGDSFLKQIPIFSGKDFLIKKFEFRIRK